MIIPNHISYILNTLSDAGFEAYVVGGCVRDALLNICPNDWDISSSALPEQVTELFSEKHTVFQSGANHGTVTVVLPEGNVEITTFRTDGEYLDRRRPSTVSFTRNINDDLARRDFTINAMAYSDKTGIIDLFSGQEHLKKSILSCVGDPEKRFNEDALRITRALRFASVYNLKIENKTKSAIHKLKNLLEDIAVERIWGELQKAITSSGFCHILSEYHDVLAVIFPNMGYDNLKNDEFYDYIKKINDLPVDSIIRLYALFYWSYITLNISNDEFYSLCRKSIMRLKADRNTINKISTLANLHLTPLPSSLVETKWLVNKFGYENIADYISVAKFISGYNTKHLENYLMEIKEKNLCCALNDLAINGNDLIANNIASGPEIGNILNSALRLVIEEKLPNDKKILLNYITNNS